MFHYSSWLTFKPKGLRSCGRIIIRYPFMFLYILSYTCIFFYIFPSPFCSLSLKQTDNSILTSSEEEYNRETVSDHHELCFKKVRRGEVVGLQRASSFSWQKRYSSMAHPGRRDHRQSEFVCPNLTAGAERAMLTRCGPSCECLFGEITWWTEEFSYQKLGGEPLDSWLLAHLDWIKLHFLPVWWHELLNQK